MHSKTNNLKANELIWLSHPRKNFLIGADWIYSLVLGVSIGLTFD